MKNKIFLVFGFGTLVLILIRLDSFQNYLFGPARGSFLTNNIGLIHDVLLFFPIALFFSVFTYKAPEKVFNSWWRFVKISVPVILILSLLSNAYLSTLHEDFLSLNDTFYIVGMSILYVAFIIGSIIQIVRGYRAK